MNLEETLSPDKVTVSESAEIKNSFRLVIKNISETPVAFDPDAEGEAFRSLSLFFPLRPGASASFTSPERAKAVEVHAPAGWSVAKTEDAENLFLWRVTPDEACELEPGESLTLAFQNVVSAAPEHPADRLSFLTVRYDSKSPETAAEAYVPVRMLPPELDIRRLDAGARSVVGVGDELLLSWTADGADSCLVQPGDFMTEACTGSLFFRPDASTAFALYAGRDNRTVSAFRRVTVVPGKALSLTSNRDSCSVADEICLTGCVSDTDHAWLNAGIGRVPVDAGGVFTRALTPEKRWNRYVLSVETPEGTAEASCTVTVEDRLELVFFSACAAPGGGRLLSWEVAGALTCVLKDAGGGLLGETSVGSRVEAPAGAIAMECSGTSGQRFTRVFL